MTGKLVKFELKKIWSSRFLCLALCALLMINVALLCGTKDWMEIQSLAQSGVDGGEEYGTFWRAMETMRKTTDIFRTSFAPFANANAEEIDYFASLAKEKYGDGIFDGDYLEPTEEMLNAHSFFDGSRDDYSVIQDYRNILWRNESARDARERVVEAAKQYGRDALEKGDDYGVRRNQAIIRLYSAPRQRFTTPVRSWGIFLFDSPSMLFVFLLLLLACSGSVSGENDRRTVLLLHTSRNGKGKTLAAKYISGAISATGLVLLFQLAAVGAIWFNCGLLGLSQPAFSLSELTLCPWSITVWQYLLCSLGCQMLSAVILSSLFLSVSALGRTNLISYGIGALLLGLFLLPVYVIPKTEWLAGPLALSSPLRFFERYYDANIFGFSVPWIVVLALLWTAFSIAAAILAAKMYHRKGKVV